MQFTKNGFIVICKEPDECEGYFASKDDCGYLTCYIEEAEVFLTEEKAKEFINEYDIPELYVYKPVEIVYTIKNIKIS